MAPIVHEWRRYLTEVGDIEVGDGLEVLPGRDVTLVQFDADRFQI